MPRGKGKKALYEKYEKCEAVQTALRKAPRALSEKYAEKHKCEHDRVDYKTVRSLAKRMVGVIEHLAKSICSMEEKFTAAKENVEFITKRATDLIDERDEKIKQLDLFDTKELQVTKWGTVKTDFDTMETNLKGVFAAGDIVRGASLVVWAIKDGRDAAAAMKTYLENIEIKKSKVA